MLLRYALVIHILALAAHCRSTDTPTELRVEPRWKKGICKNEIQTLQQNFHPQMFFKSPWYESQSIGTVLTSLYSKCTTVKSTLVGNGHINLTISVYVPLLFSTLSKNVMTTLEDGNKPAFNVSGMLEEFPVSILSTDYDNYALVYSCSPKPMGLDGYISEMVFVFRRRRGDRSKEDVIRKAAWDNGIVYEDFTWRDTESCD